MCACFLSHLLLLYIGRVHGAISGCTVLWEVHPVSAQNKSLISDTDPWPTFHHLLLRDHKSQGCSWLFSKRNQGCFCTLRIE